MRDGTQGTRAAGLATRGSGRGASRATIAGAVVLLAVLSASAHAVTLRWVNSAGDHDWFKGANWWDSSSQGAQAPGADDELIVESGTALAHENVYSSNGGSITIDGPSADVSLNHSAQDKHELHVGFSGRGRLDVRNGGRMTCWNGFIGREPDSNGTATIDGPGSTWWNYRLRVGYQGTGELSILNGGTVSSSSGFVGDLSTAEGTATVDGAGSSWACSGDLTVGQWGSGALNILNGGRVSCDRDLFIGAKTTSVGLVTVDGAGSALISSSISVSGLGGTGRGTLSVRNGGHVATSAWFYIASHREGEGSVTVQGAGSTWAHSGSLYIGGSHWFQGGLACVNVVDGGAVTVGQAVQLWQTGQLAVSGGAVTVGSGPVETAPGVLRLHSDGELRGGGRVLADVLCQGLVHATWVLHIEGNYDQYAGATALVELPIEDDGSVGLRVTGAARLAGTLAVDLPEGFAPRLGDSFEILAATEIVGTFDDLTAPDLDDGLCFSLHYESSSVSVEVTPEPASPFLLALVGLPLLRRRRRRRDGSERRTGHLLG